MQFIEEANICKQIASANKKKQMPDFKPGEYIIYQNGERFELGKIKRVTDDIHRCSFNTAVAALMEYVNELYKVGVEPADIETLAKLLKPFAPHLACEMLEKIGVTDDEWPVWDDNYLVDDVVEVVVQVNGKLRAKLSVALEELENEDKIKELALADEKVKKFVTGEPKKVIFVKKTKLVNIVA